MSSFQLSIFGTPSTGSSSSGSNPLASIFNESTLQKYARVYKPTEVEKKVAEKKEDDEALITGGKKKRKKKLLELEAARAKAAADLAAETNGTVAEDEKEQAVEEEQSQSNKKAKKDNNKKPPVVAVKEIGPAIIATEEKKVNKKTKQNEQQQQQTTQQVTKDDETDEHALNDAEATSTPGLEVSEKNSDRTLFVGNIPLKETVKSITKLFTDYGTVESCRMRSVPIAGAKVDEAGNQKLVKKVCVNSQKFGEQKGSYNAYIVYKDTDAVSGADSVKTAITAMNNKLLGDRHLRVDSATPTLFDPKRTVFVGGLPYYADEEEVRKFFSEVLDGPEDISGIRLVRDPETLVGKGIGYILFKDRECVGKALSRHEAVYKKRWPLRVTSCGKRTKRQGDGEGKSKKAKSKDSADKNPALKRINLKGTVTKKKLLDSRKKSTKVNNKNKAKANQGKGKPKAVKAAGSKNGKNWGGNKGGPKKGKK